jgi:putative ABC transport system substrate-binding protein
MRRRDFITLLGGMAVACPLAARAQQPAMLMLVIGLLESRSPGTIDYLLHAFRQGLKDTGYVEGENMAIEYRWAENEVDRLPLLAAELVRRRVAVIAATAGAQLAANAVFGSCRQRRTTGRQHDRNQFSQCRAGSEAGTST